MTSGPPELYFIFHGAEQYGPASLELLRAWRAENRIDDTTLVWETATQEWIAWPDFLPGRAAGPLAAPAPAPSEVQLQGTQVYPKGYRQGVERRNYLRIKTPLKMEFCTINPRSRQKSSLVTSTMIDNLSAGGLGFTILGTRLMRGAHLFLTVHLGEAGTFDAIGEIVRVTNRTQLGVGFREMKHKQKLLDFLVGK